MQEQLAEKFAHLLAECAATGSTEQLQKEAAKHELVKEAASPLSLALASLGGAAVGGLGGYYGTDSTKEKNRRRNALYGALSGAIAAPAARVAIPHILELLQGKAAPLPSVEPKPDAAPAKGLSGVAGAVAAMPTSNAALTGGMAGGIGGAIHGGRNPGDLPGAAGRKGELSTLARSAGGKGTPRYLQTLAELRQNPTHGPTVAAILKNDALGAPVAATKPTLSTRIFGQPIDPAFRRNQAELLADKINDANARAAGGSLPANKKITGATLLAALDKLPNNKRTPGMGRLRGGVRGGGVGLLSGLGIDALMRILTNSVTDSKNAPVK